MFVSIEQSRATGLSAVPWDTGGLWRNHANPMDLARADLEGPTVFRTALLRSRSADFDRAVADLHRTVSLHRGYFEELQTESSSARGRLLSAALTFPSTEFEGALSDLKKIARLVDISELGEDSAVRLANQARQIAAAQNNLARLQKLQRERTDKLGDALALEKEIASASEAVAQALRQQEGLQSTIAQAHISFKLAEDYRPPLQARLDGEPLRLRNALVEGISAIFSTVALVSAVLLEYGLPLLFWITLLFWPGRLVWRRLHGHAPAAAVAE
jgi:hypothetical protein